MQSRKFSTDASRPTAGRLAGAAAGIVLPAMALAAVAQLPSAIVLPALSTLLVLCGFALAAFAYLGGGHMAPARAGRYEVAGALLFLGFAAALLTDSDQALALLDHMEMHGLAALAR